MGDKAKISNVKTDRGRHVGKADADAIHGRAVKLRGHDRLKADPHAVSRRRRTEDGAS